MTRRPAPAVRVKQLTANRRQRWASVPLDLGGRGACAALGQHDQPSLGRAGAFARRSLATAPADPRRGSLGLRGGAERATPMGCARAGLGSRRRTERGRSREARSPGDLQRAARAGLPHAAANRPSGETEASDTRKTGAARGRVPRRVARFEVLRRRKAYATAITGACSGRTQKLSPAAASRRAAKCYSASNERPRRRTADRPSGSPVRSS